MQRTGMPTTFLGLSCVLMLVLSGCSGKTSQKVSSVEELPAAAPPAQNDDATCAIEGTVVDDELQPLAGAEVGLLDHPEVASVKSALDGGFALSHLAPSAYVLLASKIGYNQSTQRVDCVAGAKAHLQVQLQPYIDPDRPYAILYPQQGGFIGCALGLPAFDTDDVCTGPPLNEHYKPTITLLRDKVRITGFVLEMTWTPGPYGGQWLQLFFPRANATSDIQYTTDDRLSSGKLRGHSPINLRAEGSLSDPIYDPTAPEKLSYTGHAAASGLSEFQGNPLDDGSSKLVYQQAFNLDVAVFYNGLGVPPGFTMLS